MARLVGWTLLFARRKAGEPDPYRDYDAPDVAKARGTKSARSYNKRGPCSHRRTVWYDGVLYCSDCGEQRS